jgi:hypothetical protein
MAAGTDCGAGTIGRYYGLENTGRRIDLSITTNPSPPPFFQWKGKQYFKLALL